MDLKTFKLDELNPAHYNPRKDLKPGDKEYEKIKNSIEAFGFVEPLIVNIRDGANRIVGGHQRYKVLKELGVNETKCVIVDYDDITEKACNVALNKIGGDWEFTALADLLTELDTGAFDMELTGFDEDELAQLMGWTPDGDNTAPELSENYTQKITPPIYEPKGKEPKIQELFDDSKSKQLIADIDSADISEDIKQFLRVAAQRHTAFHFGNIAEYYCHQTPEVQDLMERSALIIIDYNKAIECGFVHLVEELQKLAEEESDND